MNYYAIPYSNNMSTFHSQVYYKLLFINISKNFIKNYYKYHNIPKDICNIISDYI